MRAMLLFEFLAPGDHELAGALAARQPRTKEKSLGIILMRCWTYFVDLFVLGYGLILWLLWKVFVQSQCLKNAVMPLKS